MCWKGDRSQRFCWEFSEAFGTTLAFKEDSYIILFCNTEAVNFFKRNEVFWSLGSFLQIDHKTRRKVLESLSFGLDVSHIPRWHREEIFDELIRPSKIILFTVYVRK